MNWLRELTGNRLLYGGLALAMACLTAWNLSGFWPSWGQFAIPVCCALLIAFRWSALGWFLSIAIFTCISFISEIGLGTFRGSASLVFLSLLTYACAFRFIASVQRDPVVTTRMNFTAPKRTQLLPTRLNVTGGHLLSLLLILLAWIGASLLCGQFAAITESRQAYQLLADDLKQNIGIVPAGWIAIKLFLILLTAVWLANEVLQYMSVNRSRSDVGGIVLRDELWKWNGREQRMISKQLRKNRK